MASPCIRYRYKKKRGNEPVIKPPRRRCFSWQSSNHSRSSTPLSDYMGGEDTEWHGELQEKLTYPPSPYEQIRTWLQKQRYIPQDLSDDFLAFFLTACNYSVESAADKLEKYFRSRQDPSPLFRNRDPLSPENINILKKLYVLPMPETTADGKKIIITGAVEPLLNYNQMDHAKALAMVFDILIWEKDFGFGDYVIVLDGRGFQCPQLLENKVHNHRSIRSLLQDTIPGTLRSFYFLYPPPHVAKVAAVRNHLWMTVIKSKQELISHLPSDSLPLEYGGNLGHLGDLLEQWVLHILQNREFFIEFEKRMTRLYEWRICHEEELKTRGKNWVQQMKLVEDEWEYKKKYYERMKCMVPNTHPAFGINRIVNLRRRKKPRTPKMDFDKPCALVMAEQEKAQAFQGPPSIKEFPTPKKPRSEVQVDQNSLYGRAMEVDGEAGESMFEDMPVTAQAQPESATPRSAKDTKGREKVDQRKRSQMPPPPEENQASTPAEVPEEESESDPEIDFEKELLEINSWLAREPYLPKNIDEEILITFLWDAQSVEQAEAKLMNYYYMRQQLYSVFRERHPCSPNNLLKYDAVCVIPLTCGTDKKWIIFATWLSHDNPTKFSIYHMTKLIFTELDILLQENQIRGKRISIIIDMKGYSVVHTAMITKFAAKRICRLFTDCFPATFNGFFIINAPEHVSDYTSLFQSFDFHIVDSLKDLQGFLPKKYLPSDMGGEPDAPERDTLFEPFFKRMQKCGNWLAYEELVRSQEMMLRMTTNREDFVYGPIK